MRKVLRISVVVALLVMCLNPSYAASSKLKPSAICIEASSGLLLAEENADAVRPPASMIKLMQMLLVSEGLEEKRWTLETPISVTEKAQRMGGTQVYLERGEVWPLGKLMDAVAVASANDAAMAVAEGLWGSEDAYKKRMNERAAELGMSRSVFNSVHGLPPDKGEAPDKTTARDMARLAKACVRHPRILEWTRQKELQFRPEEAVKYNTNKMLWRFDDCDGLKTGFIRSAGFCVTATAEREGIRLISVVMGGESSTTRFAKAEELLEDGFAQVCRVRLVEKGETVGEAIPVDNCEVESVRLMAGRDLWTVVKETELDKLAVLPSLPAVITPPITKGTPLGEARVQLAGKTLASVPLQTPVSLPEAGWRWKLLRSVVPRR
ncbi:MAG: hypothetical protein GWP08_20070 [Nitrospiraceae bacterium]|nr:hypothetical protein [Nitrospiraceae bacterium]